MYKRITFAILWIVALFAIQGCGGSGGNSDLSDPNGTFAIELQPDADGGNAEFAIEIEAEAGKVTGGFARIVFEELYAEHTFTVYGSASDGELEVIAEFGDYSIEIVAEFNGISWDGTYTVFDGKTIFEEGEISITKGSGTRDIIGEWDGELDFGKLTDTADFEILQEGNQILVTGFIDGIVFAGEGSIIGRSVWFGMNKDGNDFNFYGNVNSSADRITGDGLSAGDAEFTFDLDKDE